MSDNWVQAAEVLQSLVEAAKEKPIRSLGETGHLRRIPIESPVPGFSFEAQTSYLLNSSIVVEFQAERRYLFGLYYKSIYTILEICSDGTFEENPIYSRSESYRARKVRRNWLLDDT